MAKVTGKGGRAQTTYPISDKKMDQADAYNDAARATVKVCHLLGQVCMGLPTNPDELRSACEDYMDLTADVDEAVEAILGGEEAEEEDDRNKD